MEREIGGKNVTGNGCEGEIKRRRDEAVECSDFRMGEYLNLDRCLWGFCMFGWREKGKNFEMGNIVVLYYVYLWVQSQGARFACHQKRKGRGSSR